MFVPLHDGVALKYLRVPYATYAIIAANVLVFLAMSAGALGDVDRLDLVFGMTPAVLLGNAELARALVIVPAPTTLVTSAFLHASPLHLIGNMLFLWVFGDNVEDAMGTLRFLAFYLLCAVAAGLAYSLMLPQSDGPLIGASGAVSGVVAAYLMLYPRVQVFGLVFSFLPLRISAILCIGLWVATQVGSALFGGDAEVGWWAHVGGLAAGAALTPLMKRADVSLFSRQVG